ncbi:MAG: hypothetical protein CMO19_03055 [Thaumarchaeota archaeon]|nr:hypothetical protein [Nitrososphaerota archaeon]
MRTLVLLFILLLTLPTASGHIPYIADPNTSARNPIEIEDIHLSQVWYFKQETSDSDIWLFFNTETSDELFIQLGVPLLDQLKNYEPKIAIYHIHIENDDDPGAPIDPRELENLIWSFHEHANYTTNFPKPSDNCARGISRESPCIFHETFTDTYSWILSEDRLPVEPGQYLIRGTSEDKGTMWIAVGEREEFSASQLPFLMSRTSSIESLHGNESNNNSTIIAAASVVAFLAFVIYRRRPK